MPPTGATHALLQRAVRSATGTPLVFADSITLRRVCNLCIALFWAIDSFDEHGLALGRIGSNAKHFGTIRSVLRGMTRFDCWISAEAFAKLLPQFEEDIGIRARPRPTRTIGGVDIPSRDDEDMSWARPIPDEDGDLASLALAFARCHEGGEVFWYRVSPWLDSLLAGAVDAPENPMAGSACNTRRYFN